METTVITDFTEHINKYAPENNLHTWVAEFVTKKPLKTKNLEERIKNWNHENFVMKKEKDLSNLSVIHEGNWKVALGPLFGQLSPKLRDVVKMVS